MDTVAHWIFTAALAVAALHLGRLIRWAFRRAMQKRRSNAVLDESYLKIFNESVYPQLSARIRGEVEGARRSDPRRVDDWYRQVLMRMNRFVADKGKRPVVPEFEKMWDATLRRIDTNAR